MNLSKIPEKLFGPEYYMEYESKDVRLAISKINDFLETIGDASLSLIYCNKDEYARNDERLLNIVRRIHIRHAIVDLNNAFDILLQVPWFLYRCWKEYNTDGKYCRPNQKRKYDIKRNTEGWVEKVENKCNFQDLVTFLKGSSDTKLNTLALKIENFNNDFRFNANKNVIVRKVANQLKHKHNIKLKELNEPYSFNMTINGQEINLKEHNLSSEIKTKFYDLETNKDYGEIIAKYADDLVIDINYTSGESFLGSDLLNQKILYGIDELLSEMIDYFNNIIELYNQVFLLIKDEIQSNPFMNKPTIVNTTEYNLDEFFK